MMTLLASPRLRRGVAWLVMVAMTLTQSVQVAALTLASSPLAATTTSVVRPNLMFVLDDSGSMAWDYTPDYVNDATVTDPLNAGTGAAGSSGDTGQVTMSGPFPGSRSVTAITAVGGNLYYEAPAVVIEGGGGSGAAATAIWNSATRQITSVTVISGGSGYTSTPFVTFVGKLANAAWGMCWGTTGAFNQGGTPKDTNVSPQCSTQTQIPYATAPVNFQYYDPAVYYELPRKAAWASNCSAGSATCYYPNATPTAAAFNGFAPGATRNLTSAWPHEVWCNVSTAVPSAADPTAAGKCRENLDTSGDTLYPDAIFTFRKTYNGPASYYTMAPAEFCTDDTYTNCVRSTAPTVVGVAPNQITFNVPSRYRWCSYYNPLSHSFGNCQGRRDLSHYIPNYLGGWISSGAAGVQATATVTIGALGTPPQSLTGLSIGGVDVIGGATIGTDGASTPTTIAQSVCAAIQAETAATGYGCAASGADVLIQAALVGTAANGLQVVASGPPDVSAVNSTGEIRVTDATTGYSIDSITITRGGGGGTAQLIGGPVVATGNCGTALIAGVPTATGLDCGNQAQLICQAINSGPNQGVYIARSGAPGAPPAWGTCLSTVDAWVGIRRIPADDLDNGAAIATPGPAPGTVFIGTITVTATGGATRLTDITLGGASILSSKPLDYVDGTQTSSIASNIAGNIGTAASAGCTATATNNVVSITGTCTGALAVSAAGTAASGTFRVSSTGSTNPATLGGIQVNTANLVGNMSAAQLTNGTAVLANATAIQSAITAYQIANYTAPNRFSVAAPVAAGGGAYDVTVTAPAGNSYNGLSFTFLAGIASPGGAGSQPQWVFPITGAAADNAQITSVTCGGTTAVPTRNTGSTSAATNYIQNLTVNTAAPTYGLNGKTGAGGASGYSYACTAAGNCVVTGPVGAPACANLNITKDASITLSTTAPAAVGGSAASPGSWNFTVTDAQTDNANLSRIRCGNSSPPVAGTASTSSGTRTNDNVANTGATSTNPYPGVLAAALMSRSYDGTVGPNSFRGTNNNFTVSGTSINATISRWADSSGGAACPGGSLTVTKSGGATMTVGAVTQRHDSSYDGFLRYYYTFTISNITNPNEQITGIACSAAAGQTTLNAAASTGPAAATRKVQRLENLRAALDGTSRNSFDISCPNAATDAGGFACTISTSTACTSPTLYFSGDSSSGIYVGGTQLNSNGNFGSFTPGAAGSSPTWAFDIQNATADSKPISAINCGGTSILPSNAPNTGTPPASTVYQRINNLTGSNGVTPGSVGPTNGYTLVCQPATVSAAQPSCTLTGPVGVGACNAGSLTFNKDSSISIGAVSFTAGSGSSSATDNFYVADGNALSTAAAFGIGRAGQGATASGVAGVPVGPIATTTVAMSNGALPGVLAVPTNATGTPPNVVTMGGGVEANAATNHWNNVGIFKRTDIVAANNAYSRGSGRTDCAGATCTYSEEMQNFANWFSYYRTRMLMMKSATSIAFSELDGNYRVGFDNICQANGTTVKRPLAQFIDTGGETANQRTNWWTNLTTSTPSCATPLRAETAKIGRYFAGQLGASGDPLQYSCQQNFMFLVTDGYWNENEPATTSILGADIGNVDNVIATAPRPYYDGAQSSTTCPGTGTGRGANASSCRTLADITQYYYATDLRSSAREVLVTTAANHGLMPGQQVTISGVVSTPPAGDPNATFNGDVVAYVTGPTSFRYVPTNDLTVNATNDPGTYLSGGSISVNGTNVAFSTVSVTTGLYGNPTNAAGADVSTNNVMTAADDKNGHQHMNFYAMGLGIDGALEYRSDYQTAITGDYRDIVAGTRNWPAVANLDPSGVDDLWHATVNGHGKYFSARNLPSVVSGLREALTKIGSRVGSASAAATSNLQPVSGDNFAYVGSYSTRDWVGDLQSRSIDLLTGTVSASTACSPGATPGCQWSLQAKIDNMTWSVRRIYVKPTAGVSGDPLRVFNWGNLTGGEQAWFDPASLSQYAVLAVSNASDITAENLTEFLRGNRGLEQDGDISHAQIWRDRAHVLGDIVNTTPIYMKAPSRNYSDAGYTAFKTAGTAATRQPVVFVSAQDGFMHTINAHTGAVTMGAATVQPGEELWAYAPSQAMQNMKVLADINYSSNHRYFVDGPITVADVNFGGGDTDWHTIVVGGHGAGGTAYFALDVTDPLNPTFLWEFTNANLGYTFSNPVVSKLPNGEWAVFFTSGYNNNAGGGDGVGRLYAIDPKTGAIKSGFPMSTASGSVGTPSNLGKIAVFVDNAANNNTAKFIYVGDTNGDLWRFDFDPGATGHSGAAVFKLAHLTDPFGVGRPITTKPELTTVQTSGSGLVQQVLVGTGQYLEAADLISTDTDSFYAIKDTLGADNLGNGIQETYIPRTATRAGVPQFLKRKLISTREDGTNIKYTDEFGQLVDGRAICQVGINGAQPTVTAGGACRPGNDAGGTPEPTPAMDWDLYGGWMVDLPDPGERLNVDPKLRQGTVVFATNVPSASACTAAGSAYVNFLDYRTGLGVNGEGIVSRKVAGALVVGLTVITLPSGESKVIVTRSDAKPDTYKVPILPSVSSPFQDKRSLWREFEAY